MRKKSHFSSSYLTFNSDYASLGVYTTELLVRNDVGADSLVESQIIQVLPGPLPVSAPDIAITASFGDTLSLQACSRGDYYQWSPADGLSCTDCPNPTLQVNHQSSYTVVIGLDGAQCEDTCSIALNVLPVEEHLWFPNIFTPNSDGINDTFQGYGSHVEIKDLKIYDRWGSLVFSSTSPDPQWDGMKNGILLQPAIYIYSVVYEGLYSGETMHLSGEVLLKN